ncbi:Methoxyneurosporene dehydrogenase [Sulfitobacter noctilucicola]|uniref:1-hydroxycarotenoid 3,4-desaturase n=1 Tax=Sulfitobacter noctilucicola TaxID=1342301 RepID=A0A7W6MBX9_9RHOB|nr:1-hydroxycarotenoid 3,4-desaturase CrtD [Sulfitobacter noctilucicola]KIN70043.1 Methoxyneurosporene dehydrogenase [Sulfitobacter noctilucicola]MBB4176056.1 1-hydroxycarotenoid 3,4-desaturase [Sulfitobacter noctilucicola]
MTEERPHIAVIGAGIGGLAAALRLAHSGAKVSVFERHAEPGGKMRTAPSVAGPVDAGPTVLTMKRVFEDLFADTGSRIENHVTLEEENILARHFWSDGTTLDLMRDPSESQQNVAQVFGKDAASAFAAFTEKTRNLFSAFEGPMMRTAAPSLVTLSAQTMRRPSLIRQMDVFRSLDTNLTHQFREPKLVQLFGRYATYVGGIPDASPALLSLIWQAEAQGVWYVKGGMHKLAVAIADRAKECGAVFHYNHHIERIDVEAGKPVAVVTDKGRVRVDAVLFNGDPRALQKGMLGNDIRHAVSDSGTEPRSLSAYVHSFAATATGIPLAGHNVFFCDDPHEEFGPLSQGNTPRQATLYVCAQDRFGGAIPEGPERFELIMNAPPVADTAAISQEERQECHTSIMERLLHFGLHFSPRPPANNLTMPQNFAALFPASNGALYGRSPHGMMAAFHRPTVRSKITGLYLVGGGIHPGAGIPMATLCAMHAAEAILKDHSLT